MLQEVAAVQRRVRERERVRVGGEGGGVRVGGGGAGDAAHGGEGGVRLEGVVVVVVVVALGVGDDVDGGQSLGAGQQALIKAPEYIALQLRARTRMPESVGNTVIAG